MKNNIPILYLAKSEASMKLEDIKHIFDKFIEDNF